MTQAATPGAGVATAPPPGGTAPTAAPAGGLSGRPGAAAAVPAERAPRSTPQLLRRLSTGLVALGLVLALVGVLTFAFLTYRLQRAEDDAAQLVRVQNIQTNLLSADAAATNAFLVGGLEPAAQRTGYDRAMTSTSALIAEAAQAQPADAAALAVLNQRVLDYSAGIEQARANNRQGLPVGAQYLRLSSSGLRADALPVLDALVAANADRASAGMRIGWGYLFPVLGLLGLGALVLAQVWLARRFHRRFNPGLLVASAVLAVAVLSALVGLARLGTTVETVRTQDFGTVGTAAGARIAAYDAKANESLTLIARGSGQSFDQAWTTSATATGTALDRLGSRPASTAWAGYTKVHAQIRALDTGGRWDDAVRLATGTGKDSANTRFAGFDGALVSVLDRATAATTRTLAGQTPRLVLAAILTLLTGVAVAVLARRGLAARLREYR